VTSRKSRFTGTDFAVSAVAWLTQCTVAFVGFVIASLSGLALSDCYHTSRAGPGCERLGYLDTGITISLVSGAAPALGVIVLIVVCAGKGAPTRPITLGGLLLQLACSVLAVLIAAQATG
jgi:hypothetical protein